MTQEAYCSKEISKLLKEKGFDEPCFHAWLLNDDTPFRFSHFGVHQNCLGKDKYLCPTHQMAMAWLREVHHIAINIGWGEIFEDQYQWWCIVLNMDNGNILCEINYHASYEEAVEAALKYTLENLI